jgi:hypothetical protein
MQQPTPDKAAKAFPDRVSSAGPPDRERRREL